MIEASAPFASCGLTWTHISDAGVAPRERLEKVMPLQRDARVVVVDDDTFFVEAMLVLLPQLGLAPVACAMDGAEAIAVVREHDPDVVLVDLEMPNVDGVEAIKEISRTSPNTTLLAVTGLTDPLRAADAVAAGALACLSKTDVRERLEALITQSS
jgi:CheY-like chemotaxis protein